jgi:hypothetical protein
LKIIGAFALLVASFCSCANTEVQNTEALLSAAGFRTQPPSTQGQVATYNRMAQYNLERNTINGSTLYTYADKRKGAEKEREAWYSNYIERANQVKSINL